MDNGAEELIGKEQGTPSLPPSTLALALIKELSTNWPQKEKGVEEEEEETIHPLGRSV